MRPATTFVIIALLAILAVAGAVSIMQLNSP
jgi:hypothetical protein